MPTLSDRIRDWSETLSPPSNEDFYVAFTSEDGLFLSEEGRNWDFKDRWPFSLSDEYFGGIVRLLCAFANSGGGVVIFGVHDIKRTGGYNKTSINMDRFSQAVRQTLGTLPAFILQPYKCEKRGDVDALFIQSRSNAIAPYRFIRNIGKYQPQIFWIRQNFEVVEASPAHYPQLFCRVEPLEVDNDRSVAGSLPPNPGALQRFIGRITVIDRLFSWLQSSDEPRNYLHGKGGSGKTSIAYEFARLIKDYGNEIQTRHGTPIENVIYLSAKAKAFSPADGEIISIDVPDFCDEDGLYRQILYYGGWTTDRSYLEQQGNAELKELLIQFFSMTSCLVVIDDVDTLTTQGIDPGSDFLYRTLCRSRLHSRILYTLRNAPSQSLFNAIEVPGLEGADYTNFVKECAAEFNVAAPRGRHLSTDLPSISEGRPLVIESIIALVRTSGSYDRALTLFTQHAGENVRDYVFIREWEALTDPLARLLLAALSDLNVLTPFPDLQTVLQADPSRIQDAVGATREMFLKIDNTGSEVLYSVAPLTRKFIDSRKKFVAGYSVLNERVKNFRKNVQVSSPEVARIASRVEILIPAKYTLRTADKIEEAYRLVSDKFSPSVTESPHFKCVFGYVACCLPQPKLSEARDAFLYAIDMRVEPSFNHIRTWFNAEKGSGLHDDWCAKVADIVINGRSYTPGQKIQMISRKASSLYVKGKERIHTEQTDALGDLEQSLSLHLRSFKLYSEAGDPQIEIARQYAQNTAFFLFDFLSRSDAVTPLWDVVKRIVTQEKFWLDPLARPLLEALDTRRITIRRPEQLHRFRNILRSLHDSLGKRPRWQEEKLYSLVINALQAAEQRVEHLLKDHNAGSRM